MQSNGIPSHAGGSSTNKYSIPLSDSHDKAHPPAGASSPLLPVPPDHQARLNAGAACLQAALDYLRLGLAPLVLCDPDHIGVGRVNTTHLKTCAQPGKVPLLPWKRYQRALPTEQDVRAMWAAYAIGNVGVVLGPVSSLVRIDTDGDAAEAQLRAWSAGDLPPTWMFHSPVSCPQYLYRWPQDTPCGTTSAHHGGVHNEVRLQGLGAQTVLPPSRHYTGGVYVWVPGHAPGEIALADAPAWLVERMRKKAKAGGRPRAATLAPTPGREVDALRVSDRIKALIREGTPTGERSEALARVATAMIKAGYGDADIAGMLLNPDYGISAKPLDKGVEWTMHDIQRLRALPADAPAPDNGATPRTKRDVQNTPLSDVTNAERFVRQHGKDARYCYPWKRWLVWTGTHWRPDDTGCVMLRAKATIKSLLHDAACTTDEEKSRAILAHVKTSLGNQRLKGALEQAQSEPGVPVLPADLNQGHWLLNVQNGTVDLKTGALKQHTRGDLLTHVLPVAYDATAPCARWDTFLLEIMDGRADLVAFLQRAVGLSLIGEVLEHTLFIFHGTGQNGKGTFNDTIMALLGDLAHKAPIEMFMKQKYHARHPTERASLFGKRYVLTSEAEEGHRLNESLVKDLTGGGPITARRMNEDEWTFWPTHTIVMETNHKPEIVGTDFAIWRRIKLVPFAVRIPDEKKDPCLREKLKAELPGILRWAVEGCLAYQKDGLQEPQEVTMATAEYRAEMDIIGRFLDEACYCGPGANVKAGELYDAYKTWCETSGERERVTDRRFRKAITEKGIQRYTNNGTWYRGVGLPAKQEHRGECRTEATEATDARYPIREIISISHESICNLGSVASVASVNQMAGVSSPPVPLPATGNTGAHPCPSCAGGRMQPEEDYLVCDACGERVSDLPW